MQIFLATWQVLVPQILYILILCRFHLELSEVTNTQQHYLAARNRKEDCYGLLLLDLQQVGFLVNLVTIEVG